MVFIPESDDDYFDWLDTNPEGYVLNSDKRGTSRSYPMLHSARCSHINDRNTPNYTTADYKKICSENRNELEKFVQVEEKREMRFCKDCGNRGLI